MTIDMNNSNQAAFDYMKKIFPFPFKELAFTNNVITYKSNNVLLGDMDLQEFLNYNSYILQDLTSEDVFNILRIHVETISKVGPATPAKHDTTILKPFNITGQGQDYKSPTTLLTLDQFIMYVNKETDYDANDVKLLDRFFLYFEDLLVYEEFLIPKVRHVLNTIRNLMDRLELEHE